MYKDYDKGYEESYRELVEFRKGISLTWILGMEDFPEKNSVGGEWGRVLQAENIMHSKALRQEGAGLLPATSGLVWPGHKELTRAETSHLILNTPLASRKFCCAHFTDQGNQDLGA